jgi:hypothetical protein
MQHQADPDYPHPRAIRAAAEARAAVSRPTGTAHHVHVRMPDESGRTATTPNLIAPGTTIDVDGHQFVRVGSHWQPAGMWEPVGDDLYAATRYERWCPNCRARVPTSIYPENDRQECDRCQHQWQGRPLLGYVETRGAPWPGIRARLSDGQRSTMLTFSAREMHSAGQDRMAARIRGCWIRLERQLCGGFADADEPDLRQLARQQMIILARSWHL